MATTVANELPPDVRMMNATALAIIVLAGTVLLAAGAAWFARQPVFAFRSIRLEGEVTRNSAATIRANAAPRLAGNYFTLDLQAARRAFESVPWVRHAVIQRVFPNRLVVKMEEHHPVAVWKGDEGNDRLVNSHGEVFEANLGDVDEDNLPEFAGSDDAAAAAVLAMYRQLRPVLMPLDLTPTRVAVSDRGSWRVELDNGAEVELGRGSQEEVVARVARFVRTVTQVAARQRRSWDHADLRHADGYALRMKGPVAPVVAASEPNE
ncbi:MAG TPA: cell division protein FtsQ/DivIB [Ideonella sp.]|uniref:cell division protein FtsQ/DivIB n=1 Tax=Ideonella sp. TaxID=1929293 RepID=UPI002E3597FD|nr:cell division protein FtsQ/DivIB [Ideonella sp.]HEX5685768.1 cell division protein FtsQ/DivIB [Ideonella sp.]